MTTPSLLVKRGPEGQLVAAVPDAVEGGEDQDRARPEFMGRRTCFEALRDGAVCRSISDPAPRGATPARQRAAPGEAIAAGRPKGVTWSHRDAAAECRIDPQNKTTRRRETNDGSAARYPGGLPHGEFGEWEAHRDKRNG